jgi:hypothetical protein
MPNSTLPKSKKDFLMAKLPKANFGSKDNKKDWRGYSIAGERWQFWKERFWQGQGIGR